MNTSNEVIVRFVGQKQTSNIMINLDKIPKKQILSWKYKNGFVGRGDEWRPGFALDGMNEKGVSVSGLYAPGITTYPEYDKKDKRKVISAFELPIYILTTADSTQDAIDKIKKLQWVNAGFELYPNMFFKNIPIHVSIRDKSGKSAVIEWIDGKTVINENAGNVMTNSPAYPDQLKNAAKYASLKTTNTKMNKEFKNRVINYKKIYNMESSRPDQTALLGLHADFPPPSRFVRGTVFLDNMMVPTSSTHARRQVTDVLGAIATIGVDYSDLTLWQTVKDLDNLVVYYQELYFFQSPKKLIARDPATGFSTYDLKDIDFNTIPIGFAKEYKAISAEEAKKLKISDMPK
jgi:choloylglycine hydrolase